jgi:hypothetical protein
VFILIFFFFVFLELVRIMLSLEECGLIILEVWKCCLVDRLSYITQFFFLVNLEVEIKNHKTGDTCLLKLTKAGWLGNTTR